MDHSADDRRWAARRKFWFPSGILVDRRVGLERRSGVQRRSGAAASLPHLTAERRDGDRRDRRDRRSDERRRGSRRPSDRAVG